MRFEIHHHIHTDPETTGLLRELNGKLNLIIRNQETMMATLDQILQDVTDESTAIDSISTLIAGLKQQLADALANTTLPPDVQAKIDAVFSGAEANKAKLAAALAANTPPAPPAPGAA